MTFQRVPMSNQCKRKGASSEVSAQDARHDRGSAARTPGLAGYALCYGYTLLTDPRAAHGPSSSSVRSASRRAQADARVD
eukprot:CAMPEP_0177789956 /NCGR_PEP_ID=MMETSP0491_2-20121128/23065_1 /TAXON_ID=63592 /ORGANISM="Tetraselmis chuii, Strain PLY429" /LENGTH=79 /DNA_ID=CAMNT_0019311933 /DNA_START=84 /DNA_END=323 /DNA_ORIENTATION=-